MLIKLLKYDLKWTYNKILGLFYILAILFAIITRIFFIIDNNSTILIVIGQIGQGITISLLINILINSIVRIFVRFKNNLYGDESYLTHTLPIEKNTIYNSKVYSAIIVMLTSTIVIITSLAIMYYSKENIIYLKNTLESATSIYDSTVINMLITLFLTIFLQMNLVILIGYFSIIIGYKSNNHKVVKSIAYGGILYFIMQGLLLLIIYIIGIFKSDIMLLFTTTEIVNVKTIKNLMYILIITYLVYNIAYYLMGKKQFKEGVNVD